MSDIDNLLKLVELKQRLDASKTLTTIKGETGDKGDRGERGEIGPVGPQGERGLIGPQGERGETGHQGPEGKQGTQGRQGSPGPQGQRGEQGPQGERGASGERGEKGDRGINWRGRFDYSTSYRAHDAVEHDGSSWFCKFDTRSAPSESSPDWDLLAKRGDNGAPGTDSGGVPSDELDAIAADLAAAQSNIVDLQEADSGLESRVTSIEDSDIAQGVRLDDLESDLESLVSDVTEVDSRVTTLEDLTDFDYNVIADFGATGDGSTDDTAAIQAALTVASGTPGKKIMFPPGTYKVSATLTVSETNGIYLVGQSNSNTIIAPTTALAGLPVLKFTNVRDSYILNLRFAGVAAPNMPECAINFHRGAGGSVTATRNTVRDCYIGSAFTGYEDAVRMTCDVGEDTNNDLTQLLNNQFYNIAENGFYIGHSNSLVHDVVGCVFVCGTGIYADAGSFRARDCWFYCSDFHFQLGMDALQTQGYHPFSIFNCGGEDNSRILKTVGDGVEVYFNGYYKQGGTLAASDFIEIGGDDSWLTMTNCRIMSGQPDQTFAMDGSGTKVVITNSRLGFTHYSGCASGYLRMENNFHDPGAVVTSGLASTCTFVHLGNVGGGFTANAVTAGQFTGNVTTGPMAFTSNTAATGSADAAFVMKAVANLDTTSAHNDSILKLQRNNGTDSFTFHSSGLMRVAAGQNNGQPGFYFTTPTGGKVLFRIAGGSGEQVQLIADSANTTVFNIGLGVGGTKPVTNIGPDLDEFQVNDNGVIVKSGLDLRVGQTTNANSSRLVSNGVVESASGGFRFPDGTVQGSAAPWSTARRPTTAHALDLEFDSSTLPAAWTLSPFGVATGIDPYAQFSTANTFRYSINGYRPGWFMAQPSNEAVYYYALTASYAAPTNVFVWSRMSYLMKKGAPGTTNNQAGVALVLYKASDPANNQVTLFFNESDAGVGHEIDFQRWDAGSFAGTVHGTTTTNPIPYECVGIQKLGTTYHAWAMTSGGMWLHIGSTTATFTVDSVGIRIADAGTGAPGNAILGVDFIRFIESATQLP